MKNAEIQQLLFSYYLVFFFKFKINFFFFFSIFNPKIIIKKVDYLVYINVRILSISCKILLNIMVFQFNLIIIN